MNIDKTAAKLPAYIYCDCHEGLKHFLVINKDIQGKWSIGYEEMETFTGIYTSNGHTTIEAALNSLLEELGTPDSTYRH